jgi:ATP-dependent protease ClpP protease subunit
MEESKNTIASSLRIATIDIDGILGTPEVEQFGLEDGRVATYERFERALEEIRQSGGVDRLVLNIRSTGGCLADALLIYDATRALGVEVVTRCYGYVASAATVIAQAASRGAREISANALYLIHCCESSVEGNSQSLAATKELLDKSDERLAQIYALAAGRPVEEFRQLMGRNAGRGVWLSPEEALKAGLVDAIIAAAPITDDAQSYISALGLTPLPPKSLSERLSNAWHKVLSRVGVAKGEGSPHAEGATTGSPSAAHPSQAEKSTIGAPPVPPSRLHTAEPTRVMECEDPAPNGVPSLSPNRSAYEADVATLREAIKRGQ